MMQQEIDHALPQNTQEVQLQRSAKARKKFSGGLTGSEKVCIFTRSLHLTVTR